MVKNVWKKTFIKILADEMVQQYKILLEYISFDGFQCYIGLKLFTNIRPIFGKKKKNRLNQGCLNINWPKWNNHFETLLCGYFLIRNDYEP